MGYLQDFEHELKDMLENADTQAVIRFVKDKMLESYRNGTKATKTIDVNPEVHQGNRATTRNTKRFARRTHN